MVLSEGKIPGEKHLVDLGKKHGLGAKLISAILEQTKQSLTQFKNLANQYSISKLNADLIAKKLERG